MMSATAQRQRMVSEQLRRRDIADPGVLFAFSSVPRDEFVPADLVDRAYDDVPLPIGDHQTISQPYVVAMTAQALRLRGHEHVLEIGTGSGYAAAIFGALAAVVDTVERIPELARTAAERLARLGITNVHVHCGDGTLGWPARAPYHAIAVAAAAPRPPKSLLHQLVIGGRLVIPSGTADLQHMLRITRRDESTFDEEDLGEVKFVPLIGQEGW
jgi:protein-L-isoaspartate(D-aspartate) O-methyltransferase